MFVVVAVAVGGAEGAGHPDIQLRYSFYPKYTVFNCNKTRNINRVKIYSFFNWHVISC